MSLLRRIFGFGGRNDGHVLLESNDWDQGSFENRSREDRRAFQLVDEGLSAWAEGNTKIAETQIRRGLAAYRELDQQGIEFALGRLGALLLELNRFDEAAEALEEALEAGTTIPAIGGDYLSLIARRKEANEWTKQNAARAESALREGCRNAPLQSAERIPICYSTLVRFLIGENRPEEAEQEIRAGLEYAPEDVSLWYSLRDVLQIKQDAPGLVTCVIDRPGGVADEDRKWSELWQIIDDEARGDNGPFAEELVRSASERAEAGRQEGPYWAAIGMLGRVLERDERLAEAIETWQAAFERGSRDPLTINRLSMHLERKKRYDAAIDVIKGGLEHGLPSNIEDQLRKRLERCHARVGGRAPKETPAFSVRTGQHEMALLFQTRVSPAIREFSVCNGIGRGWGLRRSTGSWSKWSMETGELLHREESIPRLRNLQFASDGHALGATQTGPVDECVTELGFLSPEGELIGKAELPNGFSQISSETDGVWYLGCRDGGLYAYSVGGQHLWTWWTPGAREYQGDRYMRPCPYYVAASDGEAVVSSFGTVFGISSDGEARWTYETSKHERYRSTRVRLLVSPDEASQASFAELGLPTTADDQEVRTAFRRRSMETHPDRNPHLTDASEQFQRANRAYEAIMASRGDLSADSAHLDIEISLSYGDSWGSVSNLVTHNGVTHIGSAHGRVYVLDSQGVLVGEHALGTGHAIPYVTPNGDLAAAWCDETLFHFNDSQVRDLAECKVAPQGVGAFAGGLYVWQDKMVTTFDRDGHEIWAAEFAKSVNAIAVENGRLVVAGGAFAGFGTSDKFNQQFLDNG